MVIGIVHETPDLPREGSMVYADNGPYSPDFAIFKDGKFWGGGAFPVKKYQMTKVHRWFYLDEYDDHMADISHPIDFNYAVKMKPGVVLDYRGDAVT